MSKRIDARNLNVYYSKFLAVEDVNINIEPRSVTAFIGPSGCGKTTFLRTINRMHEVIPGAYAEGELLLDGDNIYAPGVDPVNVRAMVGMDHDLVGAGVPANVVQRRRKRRSQHGGRLLGQLRVLAEGQDWLDGQVAEAADNVTYDDPQSLGRRTFSGWRVQVGAKADRLREGLLADDFPCLLGQFVGGEQS